MEKFKLRDRRELYRIFGKYTFDGTSHMPDGDMLALELTMNFFKILNQQQTRETPASTFVQRKFIHEDFDTGSKYSESTTFTTNTHKTDA